MQRQLNYFNRICFNIKYYKYSGTFRRGADCNCFLGQDEDSTGCFTDSSSNCGSGYDSQYEV